MLMYELVVHVMHEQFVIVSAIIINNFCHYDY